MTLVPGVQVRVIRLRGKRGVGLVVSSKTLNLVEVGGATKWEKEISSGRFPASPRGRIRGTGASRSIAYRSSMPCPGIKRHVRCSSCRLVSTFHECPWIDPGKWHELLLHYFPGLYELPHGDTPHDTHRCPQLNSAESPTLHNSCLWKIIFHSLSHACIGLIITLCLFHHKGCHLLHNSSVLSYP